jgi:hypothetical protein
MNDDRQLALVLCVELSFKDRIGMDGTRWQRAVGSGRPLPTAYSSVPTASYGRQ